MTGWMFEAMARELAGKSPALLILTGHDPVKVEAIIKELANEFPVVKTRALIFDISSFESTRNAAAEVLAYPEPSIDILINNAGVMNLPTRTLSKDGFEMQLAINYLGAFLFTNSIMPKLLASKAPRVTNVTSNGYALSPFRFADYNFDEDKSSNLPEDQQPPKDNCKDFGVPWGLNYLPPIAYGQSKTAMILYTRELATRFKDKNLVATCCNPGPVKTDLWRQMPPDVRESVFTLDQKLASSNGAYLDDCQVKDVTPFASDAGKAQELWTLSEKLTGKSFAW
ncbi:hypothetical protein B7463_g6480, partial [Scytalidium lignicola]